jgi:hypothetical protein
MQGTIVMLMALSGLGCHHQGCNGCNAAPYMSGCYSACYDIGYANYGPGCYATAGFDAYMGCYGGCYGGGCYDSCYATPAC